MFVGVTDAGWFNSLAAHKPDEVNFWQPGGRTVFKAVETGGLFLFKLHSPFHGIAGGGIFVRHTFLPVSLAWQTFGEKNGARDFASFAEAIYRYRKTNRRQEPDPVIGCIVLTEPFFFPQVDWVPAPEDWKPNIVVGKSYNAEVGVGRELYEQVQVRWRRQSEQMAKTVLDANRRYGAEQIVTPRLGQGAFRVLVTEAYQRRCAITGEKTLPVLDAAHIKPYGQHGPHQVSNGLLLRQDIHTLFDRGYMTVNDKLRIEVSRRIKEDYGNGREYYALHGKPLAVVPASMQDHPSREYLRWHNETIFQS